MTAMEQFQNGIILKADINKAFDEIDREQAINIFINKVGHYKFLYKMKKLFNETEMRILFDFGNTDWIKA